MSKSGIRFGAAAFSAAAILGAAGATAFATTPPSTDDTPGGAVPGSLPALQAKAAAAISLRVEDLTTAIAHVDAAKNLGSTAPTLDHYLAVDISPLQALEQKIASDTSEATAQADYEGIFTDYRVFALVLPAGRLAALSDAIDNGVVPKLTVDAARAGTQVNSVTEATLRPLISSLQTQISALSNATTGVAATVLAYEPSQWNAQHELLSSARSAVNSAVADVNQARSYVRQIVAYLQGSHPAVAPPSTDSTTNS